MNQHAYITLFVVLAFLAAATPTQAEISQLTVHVDGMACPFCVFNVEKKLKPLQNVQDVNIDLETGTAVMQIGGGQGPTFAEIRQAVRDAGFTPGNIGLTAIGKLSVKDKYILLHVRTAQDIQPRYRTFYLYQPGQGEQYFDEKTRRRLEELAKEESLVAVTGSVHEHPEGLPALSTDKIKILRKEVRSAPTNSEDRS